MRALTLLATLAAPALALAGDEKPDPKGEAVSGRITFKGKPLAGGTVTFASKDGKTTVAAAIDAEGAYKAVVPAGDYAVAITTLVPKKKDDKDPPVKLPPIPAKYGDPKTTPLTATVKDGKNTFDIQLSD